MKSQYTFYNSAEKVYGAWGSNNVLRPVASIASLDAYIAAKGRR